MIKILNEKKVLSRLVILALVTTPLFGLLGGTPFLTFDLNELSNFLSGIYLVSLTTLLFWIINITLLLLAESAAFKNVFFRAALSIVVGMTLSSAVFYYFRQNNPPPFKIEGRDFAGKKMISFGIGEKVRAFKFSPADSNFVDAAPPPSFTEDHDRFFFFPQVVRSLTINLIILTLCELVFMYYRKQKIENENARLKQFNLEAKNNQLKMQLHPHFLFNSLNTLRLLLKKDPVKAEDYLMKLSDMLRFSTASALHDVVDVADELKLCLSYLQMQKVRFGDMLHFEITNPGLYSAKGKLPVYSLQLLAENAIKHNALTNELPLVIYIGYDEENGEIVVKNKIQPKKIMEATTKTGLQNLKERYHLLGNENITVKNAGGEFMVRIKILPPN